MGYQTYYEGSIYKNPREVPETAVANAINRLNYFDGRSASYDSSLSIFDIISYDVMNWYDCINNMKEISLQFPDMVIQINGWGEDNEDIWVAYFCNGKYVKHMAKIIFPEFNINELKE